MRIDRFEEWEWVRAKQVCTLNDPQTPDGRIVTQVALALRAVKNETLQAAALKICTTCGCDHCHEAAESNSAAILAMMEKT
jgi:hypothetical protein